VLPEGSRVRGHETSCIQLEQICGIQAVLTHQNVGQGPEGERALAYFFLVCFALQLAQRAL